MILAVLLHVALAADVPVTRHALVVGANDGGPGRVALRYARQDARGFGQVLMDLGGLDPNARTTLFDPSAAELYDAFDALARDLADDVGRSEVVFYYSGHSDETGLLLGGDVVPYADLRKRLEGLDADVRIAVLDSCASGAMVRGKGGRAVPGFMLDTSSTVEGYAYITSAAADESAQEADRIEGSYFTWYLTTGLRGAADKSGDGRVTLHEAYEYAFDETLERTVSSQHGPQHASYDFGLVGSGELVLTDLALTSATLILAEGFAGRAFVRDAEGHLVAEVGKPAGREVELGLAPGAYEVSVLDGAGATAATVALAYGDVVTLSASDLAPTAVEVAVARGGEPELRDRIGHLGVVPTAHDAGRRDHMAFNVGVGRSGELDGLAIGFGGNVVDHDADGVLVTLGGNVVGGELAGFSGALGFNSAGSGRHAQLSMGANSVWRDFRGTQFTLGGNLVGGDLQGGQVSLFTNVVGGELRGGQLGVGVNVARRGFTGLQGGAINLSDGFGGAQIGLVNVGGDVSGVQVGLVNVATGRVRGTQVGLVNYADSYQGMPIGVVSVVREGRSNVLVFANETEPLNVEARLGTRALYTAFGVGGRPGVGYVATSIAFGVHLRQGRAFGDVDAGAVAYHDVLAYVDDGTAAHSETVFRGRAILGVHIAERFAVFAGPQVTVDPPMGDPEVADIAPRWVTRGGDPLLWGGLLGGIQF